MSASLAGGEIHRGQESKSAPAGAIASWSAAASGARRRFLRVWCPRFSVLHRSDIQNRKFHIAHETPIDRSADMLSASDVRTGKPVANRRSGPPKAVSALFPASHRTPRRQAMVEAADKCCAVASSPSPHPGLLLRRRNSDWTVLVLGMIVQRIRPSLFQKTRGGAFFQNVTVSVLAFKMNLCHNFD